MLDDANSTPETTIEPLSPELQEVTLSRPTGISILAVLHFIGGITLFGMQFFLFANLGAMEEGMRDFGISPQLFVIGVAFLAILTIASGVGMLRGTKWGWWLGAFYYVYSIYRSISALIMIVIISNMLGATPPDAGSEVVKYIGRIVVGILLLIYFFKDHVREFFNMEEMSKRKAITILISSLVVLAVVTIVIDLLIS